MILPTATGLVIATVVGSAWVIRTCCKLGNCVGLTPTDDNAVTMTVGSVLTSRCSPLFAAVVMIWGLVNSLGGVLLPAGFVEVGLVLLFGFVFSVCCGRLGNSCFPAS